MKTLFFKNVAPIAVVALAISGAFFTTSMQSAAEAAPQVGYEPNVSGGCSNTSVQCDNSQKTFLCRIGGAETTGAQAFAKDPADNSCSITLWRPE